MISIEEGAIGGFAAHVMQFLTLEGGHAAQLSELAFDLSAKLACLPALWAQLARGLCSNLMQP